MATEMTTYASNHKALPSVVRIQKARTALLLDHPFFGTLLFRLGAQARSSIATMATDDVSLYFNPQFVETLSAAEIAGTLAHEVMHPALQHHTRRGGHNPRRWNMACDYAINPMLVDAGLTLPKDVLLDNRFRGMSAERIYNLLEEDEQNQSSSSDADSESQDGSADSGGGGSDTPESSNSDKDNDDTSSVPQTPGGIGQVLDAPEPENGEADTVAKQARDWQIAGECCEVGRKAACRSHAQPGGGSDRGRRLAGAAASRVVGDHSGRLQLDPVRTPVMSGAVCTCQVSSAKVSVRSVSRSTAPAPSTPVSLACSRRRCALSSPVNSLNSSMFCTSILKCRRLTRTMQGCRSSSRLWAEVGPTSGPASGGWKSVALPRKRSSSLRTCAAAFRNKRRLIQFCGRPLIGVPRPSDWSFRWKRRDW